MELRIELIPARMPMAVSFVETAAKAAGLISTDVDKLALSVEELFRRSAAVCRRTKLIFICNPNNPTGTWWSRERLTRFLQQVGPQHIIVLDEAYC